MAGKFNGIRMDEALELSFAEAADNLRVVVREFVDQSTMTDQERARISIVITEIAGELALENAGVRLTLGEGDDAQITDTGIAIQRVASEVVGELNVRI